MINTTYFQFVPGIEGEELIFIKSISKDLPEDQLQLFLTIYNGKRVKTDTILITTILGFFGIAGIQRFLMGQIGMGILYLLTWGICFIGTIIDLVNYKKMTLEHNQKMAQESMVMTRQMHA